MWNYNFESCYITALLFQYYGKSLRTTGLEYGMKVDDLHRFHFKTGDWTDDSDQMLAILQSLLDMDGEVCCTTKLFLTA